MGNIRFALDWLKTKGLAEKYNPYHHPKGSPLGGKFAPKSMAGGGSLAEVPYRGSKVHQLLVKKGLAKPWEPKTKPKESERETTSAEGDKARALAKELGISVTRARRALFLGVEEEARQYAETHKKEIESEKRARRRDAYHDKLYREATRLAVDVDDLDVLEHFSQGSISRLKEFIASRKR